MNKIDFAKGVERLINPISVGTLHFMQSFNTLLPRSIQEKFVQASSKKTPFMGFVVEPYGMFLCYEIIDLEKAKSLLPDGFKLIKTKIFADDEPKYYSIFGCVRAHTSAFWGSRTEFYIIAEDESTGLLSWIIIDYVTDTISYDNKNGLVSPNSDKFVLTTNYLGKMFIDIEKKDNTHKLKLEANIENGIMKKIDERLWLEGNLSIGYGRNLSDNGAGIFALRFEPGETDRALKIFDKDITMELNTWYSGLFEKNPSQVACFPYAQHFISDSPGHSSVIKNRQELIAAANKIDFDKVKVYSTKSFKIMFLISAIVSFSTTVLLVVLLILK
jgi:hypothetical protein